MLSLLPPELLQQIIESTIPHAFHSQTYDERQATLLRLSFVSRRFRQISQTLLFEIVLVHSPETLEMVTDTIESKGFLTALREAICRVRMHDQVRGTFSRRNFERLSQTAQNLRILALRLIGHGGETMDLSVLQLLPRERLVVGAGLSKS